MRQREPTNFRRAFLAMPLISRVGSESIAANRWKTHFFRACANLGVCLRYPAVIRHGLENPPCILMKLRLTSPLPCFMAKDNVYLECHYRVEVYLRSESTLTLANTLVTAWKHVDMGYHGVPHGPSAGESSFPH